MSLPSIIVSKKEQVTEEKENSVIQYMYVSMCVCACMRVCVCVCVTHILKDGEKKDRLQKNLTSWV